MIENNNINHNTYVKSGKDKTQIQQFQGGDENVSQYSPFLWSKTGKARSPLKLKMTLPNQT